MGDLVSAVSAVTEQEVDALVAEYKSATSLPAATWARCATRPARRCPGRMLEKEGAGAFSNTFEDLYGMEQLPGSPSA